MADSGAIDFYFDFSSPYGYLMSEKIDELAARYGRPVNWRPVLLGPIFKVTGGVPLTQAPVKGEYAKRDFMRSARFLGVPFALPPNFPESTQHAARAFYWLHDRDGAMARAFAHAVYRAYFVEGRDISGQAEVIGLAAKVGVTEGNPLFGTGDTPIAAALGSTDLKARLRSEVDAALATGVCGSPYLVIDGEPFLGVDRLPQIEKWLATGGF